jgi:hypothetical protein
MEWRSAGGCSIALQRAGTIKKEKKNEKPKSQLVYTSSSLMVL